MLPQNNVKHQDSVLSLLSLLLVCLACIQCASSGFTQPEGMSQTLLFLSLALKGGNTGERPQFLKVISYLPHLASLQGPSLS